MKKILFIVSHRKNRAPGQRFRCEQYLSYLSSNGFQCDFSPLFTRNDDKLLYEHGRYLKKIYIALKCWYRRIKNILQINRYDIVFIYREAFMVGNPFFEKQFRRSKAKIIFDFDDAVWLHDISDANRMFGWLKKPEKTSEIIAMSDMIFAGNKYLAQYASVFNSNIRIVPTTIDTEEYKPVIKNKKIQNNNLSVCIGWSGSITTIKHFEFALPALAKLKEKYRDKIRIKVIGDGSYTNKQLDIQGIAWTKENELKELSEIDIGIMPLPDDEWTKGKCGLKGLQYMALEIPAVMAPVGVNTEIIQDGENGFLAGNTEEWCQKISMLIDSPELRKQMGQKGRKTVMEKYSVESQKENYLRCFKELCRKQVH